MGHIYWIASYPKSGNTWMRSFLQALFVPAERVGLNELGRFAPDENLGTFYQPLLTRPVAETSLVEQAAVRPRVHARIAAGVQGFQFLKTHSMYARHLGTPTLTPAVTAGAIYIVRNPLDIVVSYSHFRDISTENSIKALNEAGRIVPRNSTSAYVPCGSWGENVLSWTRTASDRLLVLRYEDMLAQPLQNFGRVAAFLNADVAPEVLEAAVERTSFERLQQEEAANGFNERPNVTQRFFREGKTDQWRDVLSAEQVAAVVRPNRAAMERFGYWRPEYAEL